MTEQERRSGERRDEDRREGERRERDRRTGDRRQEERRGDERRRNDQGRAHGGADRRDDDRRAGDRRAEDRRSDDRRDDDRRTGDRRAGDRRDDEEEDTGSQPAQSWEPTLIDARTVDDIGAEKPGQLDSRLVHEGPVVHLSTDTVRFPDGSTGSLELVRHSGAAAVVPILGDADGPDPEIILVRQFRYAAGGDIYEIPAGRPDRPGEPWEDVARRELEEETGYVAGHLRRLTTIYTTPGFTDERIHIFLATNLSRGTTNLDADEFVDVMAMPRADVMDAIRDGRIIDGKSLAGLLYYARFAIRL